MTAINKVVVFRVGNEEYAVPIPFVISIEKMEGITPIPNLPIYVKGIAKVRGELIPAADFENILYSRPLQADETSRMIVLQTEELSFAILVNEAREILDISSENLKQPGLIAYQKTNYFTGVANMDERLITLIDPSRLVESLEGIREIKEYMKTQQTTV
ncbi:chemotaxis protein CheW [Cytobacillus sp. NCCP-133]|uniref:chemotaxis protein CheW n=1 Tax=Cytobacillus sp. NCCP-133 TaxID=766848 RepID=UPI00222FBCDA|nr:chemotaxis protein CheW [Cytobacillus sp. NCCP-133]GLB58108.1 chemotaxis protein CheW [Cytobacillus sp. NCCP-133]